MVFDRVIEAETEKQSALGETIFGIKTVKSLALEPQRKALWDERVAEAGKWRTRLRQAVQLAADPGHADRAVHVDGRHPGRRLSRDDRRQPGYMVGSLFAFMMLSQRVAQPLVGLARLIEE